MSWLHLSQTSSVRNTSEAETPDSKESRVGASTGNLDEDLRRGRHSSAWIAFWALRMITLPRSDISKVQKAPGTAGSRHTWPRGSQCVHIGQPGSKMRTILRHIQRAYFRRNRRTGGGARSITVHSRRCLPQPRHCTHQAHRAWTRRRHCSETAKRSGLVPGIHSQSTFLHSRFAAGRMGATVQKEIHVDFWRFSYNFSFKRKFESEEGAWTSFDSTHTTGDLIHYDPQHKPRRG
jgi:hypothetical protein